MKVLLFIAWDAIVKSPCLRGVRRKIYPTLFLKFEPPIKLFLLPHWLARNPSLSLSLSVTYGPTQMSRLWPKFSDMRCTTGERSRRNLRDQLNIDCSAVVRARRDALAACYQASTAILSPYIQPSLPALLGVKLLVVSSSSSWYQPFPIKVIGILTHFSVIRGFSTK